jgi:Tol biopolymer transport system component
MEEHMNRVLMRSGGALLAAILAAHGCGSRDASSEAKGAPTRPSLMGRLVYQRGEGKRSEIWVMDLASYTSRRLTENGVLDEYPRWSPDGREIAFYSDRGGTRQIYLMDAEGKNVRAVTGHYPINEDPSWSPDCMRLCFWAQPDKKAPENLFIINSDGTGMVTITRTEKGTRRVPAWSPDGGKIAFTSDRYLSHQIYTIDVDGRNEQRLTSNPRGACRPRWSPDGRRLAYSEGGYSLRTNVDIWEMDPDGGNKRRLTEDRGSDYDPAYSPDGRKIIFASNMTGCYELYVMDRDGSHEVRLTYHNDYTRYPDWAK